MEIVCDKITIKVLKEALSQDYGVPTEVIEVQNFVLKPGSKKGDGFSCEIAAVQFLATVNGNRIEKSYIAKYGPEGNRGEVITKMKVFDQETRAYTWLIPEMQKTRKRKQLKPLTVPKCFYASVQEQLILLENLKDENYEVVLKKPEPLTLNAFKMVLKELASLHASGYHFIQTYPGGIDALAKEYPLTFTEDYLNRRQLMDDEMAKQWFDMTASMFKSTALVVRKYGPEDLANRMDNFHKQVHSVMESFFTTNWKISYLMHGDAWYNNFLYRYPSGGSKDPTDVAMVDLQGTRLGKPGLELSYLFCSSTSPDQMKSHFQELLQLYYNQFSADLQKLGNGQIPCFTFEELKQEYDECYAWGFLMGCLQSQVLLVSEDSDASFGLDNFGDEDATNKMLETMEIEFLRKVAVSPDYRNLVLGLVDEAAARKVI